MSERKCSVEAVGSTTEATTKVTYVNPRAGSHKSKNLKKQRRSSIKPAGKRAADGSKNVKVKSLSRGRLFATPWTVAHQAPLSMGIFPGKNTGVGCLALLQGIFPTQGWNPGTQHRRWILYHLCHQGSPRILEWVAYPFSRRSS